MSHSAARLETKDLGPKTLDPETKTQDLRLKSQYSGPKTWIEIQVVKSVSKTDAIAVAIISLQS